MKFSLVMFSHRSRNSLSVLPSMVRLTVDSGIFLFPVFRQMVSAISRRVGLLGNLKLLSLFIAFQYASRRVIIRSLRKSLMISSRDFCLAFLGTTSGFLS